MEFMNYLLFGIYPYVCFLVFVGGSLLRFNRDQYHWKSDSSQMLRTGSLRWGSNLFHIGILMLFVGHLVGFFSPIPLLHALGITPEMKQMLAIVLGSFAGIICFIGLVFLIIRRLGDVRIRKNSRFSDILLLFWLITVLSVGLISILTSLQHRDGSMIIRFMYYVQHIFTFQGDAASLVLDAPIVYKVHMFLAMTLFLIFPFTRLVHIWSGFGALFSYAFRKRQIVRRR